MPTKTVRSVEELPYDAVETFQDDAVRALVQVFLTDPEVASAKVLEAASARPVTLLAYQAGPAAYAQALAGVRNPMPEACLSRLRSFLKGR